MYNDPTDNLIRSDFEELKGQPEPQSMDCKYNHDFFFFVGFRISKGKKAEPL